MPNLPKNLETILHIGAGHAEELPEYLRSDAKRIILVEPHPKLAEKLRQQAEGEPRVEVLEFAVSDEQGALLHEFNIPEASSLYRPTGLYGLFPGLREVSEHQVPTKSPEKLFGQVLPEGARNGVVIQAPGAEQAIIESLVDGDALERVSHLAFTSSLEPYYDSNSSAEAVLNTLKEQGFEVAEEDHSNIDWPQWHMVFDARANTVKRLKAENECQGEEIQSLSAALNEEQGRVERLEKQLADNTAALAQEQQKNATLSEQLASTSDKHSEELRQREERLAKANREISALTERLQEQQGAHEKLEKQKNQKVRDAEAHSDKLSKELSHIREAFERQKKQLESAQTAQSQAEQKASDLAGKVHLLEQQLSAQKAAQQQSDKLMQRMEYLFEQQGLQLEQAANALGRHVSVTAKTTAKELEAGLQLQQQYGSQLVGLEERGKRLPATVALELSRQLKTQPYDVIIEMGSGVTTSFLAHTVRNRPQETGEKASGGSDVAHYIDPSDEDLPKRIVCFEHSRKRFNDLQSTLKQSGLTSVVNLHFAPLVPFQHQGKEYLYYDCASRLQQLANLFENREARIFVLLNETADEQQPDRFAALPQLLQYLSAHTLDVVVNDVDKHAELINQWQALLNTRGLEYQPAVEFGAPTAQRLTINP